MFRLLAGGVVLLVICSTVRAGDFEDGLKALGARKYGQAVKLLNAHLAANPGHAPGYLARGVSAWLDHEIENGESNVKRPRLVSDWDAGTVDKPRTARAAEVVLQALVEHYDEYRDYNTTTTQSDYGENIHILLDILRLKVRYDRFAWRMRPLALAHEVLCQRSYDALAARWRSFIAEKTSDLADELLKELTERETRYGVKLRTVRDCILSGSRLLARTRRIQMHKRRQLRLQLLNTRQRRIDQLHRRHFPRLHRRRNFRNRRIVRNVHRVIRGPV